MPNELPSGSPQIDFHFDQNATAINENQPVDAISSPSQDQDLSFEELLKQIDEEIKQRAKELNENQPLDAVSLSNPDQDSSFKEIDLDQEIDRKLKKIEDEIQQQTAAQLLQENPMSLLTICNNLSQYHLTPDLDGLIFILNNLSEDNRSLVSDFLNKFTFPATPDSALALLPYQQVAIRLILAQPATFGFTDLNTAFQFIVNYTNDQLINAKEILYSIRSLFYEKEQIIFTPEIACWLLENCSQSLPFILRDLDKFNLNNQDGSLLIIQHSKYLDIDEQLLTTLKLPSNLETMKLIVSLNPHAAFEVVRYLQKTNVSIPLDQDLAEQLFLHSDQGVQTFIQYLNQLPENEKSASVSHFFQISKNASLTQLLSFQRKLDLFKTEAASKLTSWSISLTTIEQELQNAFSHTIETAAITPAIQTDFFQKVIANHSPTETAIEEIPLSTDGLPLQFSRQDFITQLNQLTQTMSAEDKQILFQTLDIEPTYDRDQQLCGYEGIPNFNQLSDSASPLLDYDPHIKQLFQQFFLENAVVTANEEVNDLLNALITALPEFLTVVGKKQHQQQQYPLDTHTFKVLQETLNHPQYNQLNSLNKVILKLSIILHDLAKTEGVNDPEHDLKGALYARDLLQKFKLSTIVKDRVFSMVKHHHWLADLDEKRQTPTEVAAALRYPQEHLMAQIFTQADLKGVSEDFYQKHQAQLSPDAQKEVSEAIAHHYEQGIPLMFTPLLQKNIPLIDLTTIAADADVSAYGFAPDTKKQNLRFAVHFIDDFDLLQNLKTVQALSNVAYESVLSLSIIKPDKTSSYNNFKFGFLMDIPHVNIAAALNENFFSGYQKGFSQFAQILSSDQESRTYIRTHFLSALQKDTTDYSGVTLNSSEYGQLYQQLIHKNSLNQIRDDDVFSINEKKLSGKQVKSALQVATDSLFDTKQNQHNEIVAYHPQISGIIAKVNQIADVPAALQEFAQNNHLPIILVGSE